MTRFPLRSPHNAVYDVYEVMEMCRRGVRKLLDGLCSIRSTQAGARSRFWMSTRLVCLVALLFL